MLDRVYPRREVRAVYSTWESIDSESYDEGVSSYAGAEDRPRTLTTLLVMLW